MEHGVPVPCHDQTDVDLFSGQGVSSGVPGLGVMSLGVQFIKTNESSASSLAL